MAKILSNGSASVLILPEDGSRADFWNVLFHQKIDDWKSKKYKVQYYIVLYLNGPYGVPSKFSNLF